jgi:membrane fusion protein, multidrug efflux system
MNTTAPLKPVPSTAAGPAKPHSRRGWIWAITIVLLVAGLVAFLVYRAKNQVVVTRGNRQGGTITVATAKAEKGKLNVYLTSLGTVTPLKTVTMRSRADGELMKIHFTEGQLVENGALLAEIDPRSYQVALQQAEAQRARDRATLENARRDLERYQNAEAAVTQQQLDTAKSTVAQSEGTSKADDAAVENAKLLLSYCRIVAPFAGRAGLRLIDEGNLVHASDQTGILVLTQEEPIAVIFSIAEDDLPQVRKPLGAGEKLTAEAYDRSMKQQLATGELFAVDNQIDATTGTVRLKAVFANKDHGLYPNQFVNVRLLVDTLDDMTLVPSAAIQVGAQTRALFVYKEDGTVERRDVKVGRSEGEKTAVLEGVAVGEVVVLDGLDKLQTGMRVSTRERPAGPGAAGPGGQKRGGGKRPRP